MIKETPLFKQHQLLGAKLIEFSGWQMPLHYGSQLAEHMAVREKVGIFDVSHMNIVDIHGENAKTYLRYLLANDVDKLKTRGKALYGCMLNEAGGIKDDLIVYWLGSGAYRLILNAGTREKDLNWLCTQAKAFPALYFVERTDLSLLALQGPLAAETIFKVFPEVADNLGALKPFSSLLSNEILIARTGYTGEDGFEIAISSKEVLSLFQHLLELGVQPCGLGARDTLRLEAGMHLYGTDLDEDTSPLESGLAWTVAWEPKGRAFIGRKALEAKRSDPNQKRWVGLILRPKGVLRNHLRVRLEGGREGEITSGGFSPVLKQGIGFARLPEGHEKECLVEIRGKWLPVEIVSLPFVRFGKKVIGKES